MKRITAITPAVGEMIEIAVGKIEYPDYNKKHGLKAKNGWYRYNARFAFRFMDRMKI